MKTHLIFIFLTNIIGYGVSLIPEVSQEGLLQPYSTYADVTLFHFHIPHEVTRVTWEFAAFMDDPGCPIRDVHILIQHGSYPLVKRNNATFQDYMYIERSSLHKVTTKSAYLPHNATLLPIYNPLPGSWFAAAYISNWNEQMQQEGIVHKCRYSLGSIAMWNQKERIQTLNSGVVQTVRTQESLSYYRFYVPSHTWALKVTISNCRVLEQIIDEHTGERLFRWCINSISLQARSLPTYNPDNGVGNITQGGAHTFIEPHPFSDGYYYLLIDTAGETSIDITIKTRECGILSNPVPRLRKIRSNYAEISSKEELKVIGTVSPVNITVSVSSLPAISSEINNTSEEEQIVPDFRCYPILPLARIRHASDFMDTFLIQGTEWYSTWLSVEEDIPVFTHFTILPYMDIGGTLGINIHMDEMLMNATSQLITVQGCLRKGRPPDVKDNMIICNDKKLTLNITSISSKTVEDFLNIPFPEPDKWFLALQTICYYKGLRSPCIIDQAMVSVDIRTQPCVYSGDQPCGNHGMCQETHRGMFFFTSCVCSAGWQGWGCEDGAEAQGWNSVITGMFLLTVSNIFFLPPAIIAINRKLFSQALLLIATMIASIFYHTCDNEVVSFCIMKFEVLQFTDFFFSLLCFWVTIVGLGGVDDSLCPLLHTLGVVIIAPAVQYSRTALASFIIPMVIAVIIPICHVLYRRRKNGIWPSVSRHMLLYRGSGILIALLGLMMFALIQTKDNYKFVHSAWHVAIALSLVFLLPSNGSKSVSNSSGAQYLSTMNSTDAELIDVGPSTVDYTAHSPVFNVSSDVAFLLDDGDDNNGVTQ